MKKAILFLYFAAQFIASNGQTVSISCNGGGGACFTVEPCLGTSTYFATIDDGNFTTTNGYTRVINWTPTTGASTDPIGNGSALYTLTWNNQANSPSKSIKVDVTYQKTGASNGTATDTKSVVVKFIAPVPQINVSGAISASPTNGGTVSVPCGGQSMTLSVPTPTTDPFTGVVYVWSLPSGWSGSSSTNSISVTTNAGGDGTVSVSARRSDGSCFQICSFNVTRPVVVAPTIAGVSAMCSGDYATLTGNATNATSFSWTTTGAISKLYQSSNYVLVAATSNGYDGTATLTADNECQSPQSVTKTIFVGGPHITSATVNGQSLATPNYIYNPALLNIQVNNPVQASYDWTITQGTGSIYYNGQNQISAYAYPFVRIEAATSNQCGAGDTRTFYLYDISGGYYRMASPNPATSAVSAEVLIMGALKTMTLVSDTRSTIVRTFNPANASNTDTQRANNTVSFDVSRLPRGKYYLNFAFEGNKTFTEQIVLE